jgi:hypothetical protein
VGGILKQTMYSDNDNWDDHMCGCDVGQPCTSCPFQDDSDSEEYYNELEFKHPFQTRIPKGHNSVKNIYERELEDQKPFNGSECKQINVLTMGGNSYIVDVEPQNEDIVLQMKDQYPEFKDDDFIIIFTGGKKITDKDFDHEFVHSKEKMGVLPYEISNRILDGRIDLTDPQNLFVLVFQGEVVEEGRCVNQDKSSYVFKDHDFVELES